jgi:glycosyltransferase involved in cell wall biosynthesis
MTDEQKAAPMVVHVIPYDGIGGVEIAARTLADGTYSGVAFAKLYLVDKSRGESENSPTAYFRSVSELLRAKPDVVIASLWRSCLVMIALKILRPRTRCVTFLHSSVDMHVVDRWANRLAMLFSDEVWADSGASLFARMKVARPTRIISFLTERKTPSTLTQAGPRFIFWGRLHWQKNLPRAVRLFAKVAANHQGATFDIIGPDDGAKNDIEAEIARTGVQGVRLLGPMQQDEIFSLAKTCSFYLQTSVEEGAAMSVMEAMQLGLIPVVTPVGEIGSYCLDGENAIVVTEDDAAAQRVSNLLGHVHSLARASTNAYRTWSERPLYREDVLSACRRLAHPGGQ